MVGTLQGNLNHYVLLKLLNSDLFSGDSVSVHKAQRLQGFADFLPYKIFAHAYYAEFVGHACSTT